MPTSPFIYLASLSPRRADLLKQIGTSFQPLFLRDDPRNIPSVDETPLTNEAAMDYIQRICLSIHAVPQLAACAGSGG